MMPGWALMWCIAFGLFYTCKVSSLWRVRYSFQNIADRKFAYLFAWPGMDAEAFCTMSPEQSPTLRDWLQAAIKTIVGGLLFWVISTSIPEDNLLLRGWVGMIGLILILHFGFFHLLALFWQSRGVNALPIMRAPLKATSLGEFWGSRWNLGFRQVTHDFVYAPLRKYCPQAITILISFLFSGFIHELVISVPAKAGYGLPTAYFLIQGLGVLFERSAWGKAWKLGMGWRGRFYTILMTITPLFLLFHSMFVTRVIVPFMDITALLG